MTKIFTLFFCAVMCVSYSSNVFSDNSCTTSGEPFPTQEEAYNKAYECGVQKLSGLLESQRSQYPHLNWGTADSLYLAEGGCSEGWPQRINAIALAKKCSGYCGFNVNIRAIYGRRPPEEANYRCHSSYPGQLFWLRTSGGPGFPYVKECFFPFRSINSQCAKYCPKDFPLLDLETGECYSNRDAYEPDDKCEFNPVNVRNGEKIQNEIDYILEGPFPITLSRTYKRWRSLESHKKYHERRAGNIDSGYVKHIQPTGYRGGRTFSVEDRVNQFNVSNRINKKNYAGYKSWSFNLARPKLIDRNESVISIHINGEFVSFKYSDDARVYLPVQKRDVSLEYTPNAVEHSWVYKDDQGEKYVFNGEGDLVKHINKYGLYHEYLSGEDNGWLVRDQFGNQAVISVMRPNQISSVKMSNGVEVHYHYDEEFGNLVNATISNSIDGELLSKSKKYHYGSEYELTGITDENDVRYATWKYDAFGRVTESQHINGIDKGTLAYETDKVSAINSLGKKTTYHYGDVAGAKRLVKVEGHQSENCQASNQAYTYYDSGKVKTKTDWNGNVTHYEYTSKGKISKKINAYNTDDAYEVIFEWDDIINKPISITYPDRKEVYQYSDKGNLINKKSVSL